jgi:hypothetical protein
MIQSRIFHLLIMVLLFTGCSDSPASDQPDSQDSPKNNSPAEQTNTNAPGLAALVGEWEQKFSSMDRNDDGELQDSEKVPAEYKVGFNYFEFRENGECFRDSDLKLPGTYEVKTEGGEQVLYIHNTQGMMSETYRYNIESLSANELVLSESGAFLIFTRK